MRIICGRRARNRARSRSRAIGTVPATGTCRSRRLFHTADLYETVRTVAQVNEESTMTQCIRTAYGYKLIFSERMLDLQTPRLIRVSYLETDQRKSRLVRGVSKVVKDDGDLYAF